MSVVTWAAIQERSVRRDAERSSRDGCATRSRDDRATGRVKPEVGEFVGETVGGRDDPELFRAAAERIGDGGIDGSPDGIGVFVEGEFGEDKVRAVTADGVGIGGQGEKARTVGPANLGTGGVGFGQRQVGRSFEVVIDLEFEDLGPVFGFGERLQGLTFAGGENDPGSAGMVKAINHRFGRSSVVFAGLASPEADFEARVVRGKSGLVG